VDRNGSAASVEILLPFSMNPVEHSNLGTIPSRKRQSMQPSPQGICRCSAAASWVEVVADNGPYCSIIWSTKRTSSKPAGICITTVGWPPCCHPEENAGQQRIESVMAHNASSSSAS
jgi:hypothetical protein